MTLLPAKAPNAILPLPVVLNASAKVPMAVLPSPVVLLWSAERPMAAPLMGAHERSC